MRRIEVGIHCFELTPVAEFTAVKDVKAAAQKAERTGARVLVPATVLPEGDAMAVLLDPQGMSFAVWRAAGKQ
ncbi:MAG TPA: hypothetical protein VFA60_01860 [Terriglobales bacterium]|nr:hypothetical protein [Terriglobales bacterium]